MRGGRSATGERPSVFGVGGLSLLRQRQTDQRVGRHRSAGSRDCSAPTWRSASVGGRHRGRLYGRAAATSTLGAGDYRAAAWTASGYARAGIGPFRLLADGTYGEIRLSAGSRRRVSSGRRSASNRGTTDGDYVAGRGTAAVDLFTRAAASASAPIWRSNMNG